MTLPDWDRIPISLRSWLPWSAMLRYQTVVYPPTMYFTTEDLLDMGQNPGTWVRTLGQNPGSEPNIKSDHGCHEVQCWDGKYVYLIDILVQCICVIYVYIYIYIYIYHINIYVAYNYVNFNMYMCACIHINIYIYIYIYTYMYIEYIYIYIQIYIYI